MEDTPIPSALIQATPIPARPGKPQTGFRSRGFSFLKQAGTNRTPLVRYMNQSAGSWVRYATSALVRTFPRLAPKPEPTDNHYHYTAPIQDPETFSFILVGDTGMNSPGQYLVSSALSHQNLYPSEFCLILGDVMYPSGGAEQYQLGLLEAFKHYPHPILALPGNHDWYDNLNAYRRFFIQGKIPKPLCQAYTWQSPRLPNFYYHMDIGENLRIICLDTGISGTLDMNQAHQLAWLDIMLETAQDRKVLLMMHHPLYSLSGREHETTLRQHLLPRLDKANVIGIFSGHDHNYQRHEVDGRMHLIQGAGGASLHHTPETKTRLLGEGLTHIVDDQHFSFTHCQWAQGKLTCTTFSAHELPGRILDRFVLG